MALLTKDQILAADDRKRRTVAVPEWGGDVIVASMTGTERDAYEMWMLDARNGKREMTDIRARLLTLCLVDEAGKRLFTDAEIAALGTKSASVLDRLFTVARNLNSLSDEDLEQLGKASATGQNGASGSV
jgi:hypothetical protein